MAVAALSVSAPTVLQAQGTSTYLSNLEQPSAGSSAVGSDSWLAAGSGTGANPGGYLINFVQITLTDPSGAPGNLTVMLYTDKLGGFSPANNLGALNGPDMPATAGSYNYIPGSSLTLSPNTDYFIVLTASSKVATGAYDWSSSGANNYNPNGGWFSLGGGWTSGNGTSWNAGAAVFSQFAINATAAPEPGTLGLLALGGLVFGLRRARGAFNSKLKVQS